MADGLALAALLLAAAALAVATSASAQAASASRRLDLLLRGLDLDLTERLHLSDRVKKLAANPAHKIAAIKAYRDETGAGLADAKAAVELYIASLKR
jgi:ribosomal protein L7/L12